MKALGNDPHKALTRLIGLSIIFDIIAVVIWVTVPATQAHMNLDTSVVTIEAAIAAALFTVTYIGLAKRLKWAPVLALVIPVAQRIFGTYVFFPSPAIAATLVWSLIIIYFAFKNIKER